MQITSTDLVVDCNLFRLIILLVLAGNGLMVLNCGLWLCILSPHPIDMLIGFLLSVFCVISAWYSFSVDLKQGTLFWPRNLQIIQRIGYCWWRREEGAFSVKKSASKAAAGRWGWSFYSGRRSTHYDQDWRISIRRLLNRLYLAHADEQRPPSSSLWLMILFFFTLDVEFDLLLLVSALNYL